MVALCLHNSVPTESVGSSSSMQKIHFDAFVRVVFNICFKGLDDIKSAAYKPSPLVQLNLAKV